MNKRIPLPMIAFTLVMCAAILGLPLLAISAQGGAPPPSFNDALADLSKRVGRTLTLTDFDNSTSRWEWRGVTYQNSALDCPNEGETPTTITVVGYQFIFVLRGRKYDYRVAYNDPKTLRLCTNPQAGQQYDLPTVPATTLSADPPASFNAALADLARRLSLNLTLADFDSPRSRWAWRYREFRNSQLECPKSGETVDQVITPGYVFTFVYERVTYEYRVSIRNPDNLLLCRGDGLVPRASPTPRPTSTPRP